MNSYPKSGIEVIVKDEQGLGEALMKDGITQIPIDDMKLMLQRQFEIAVKTVFKDILRKPMPRLVVIYCVPSNRGESSVPKAGFLSRTSSREVLCFDVHEPLVRHILEKGSTNYFKRVVYHEVIHAADWTMIIQTQKLLEAIRFNICRGGRDAKKRYETNILRILYDVLRVFEHLRNEGVAMLGEYMLGKEQFGVVSNALKRFNRIYERTLSLSIGWFLNGEESGPAFNVQVFGGTYRIAPAVLVHVLDKRGDLEQHVTQKVLEGLETGCYKLSDVEMGLVIRSALSLSLSDYIQGVVLLGDEIAPLQLFLEFCAFVQQEFKWDEILAFTALVKEPKTRDVFIGVMKKNIQKVLPKAALEQNYQAFVAQPSQGSDYCHLREKADLLYMIYKNSGDLQKRRIAQWALSYLFEKFDVVYDDLNGVGLVDDMIVLDYALTIIETAD